MSRTTLLLAFTAALLPALAIADDTTVYRTKNADGTTTYSQIETSGAQATTVDAGQAAPAAGTAVAAEAPKSEAEINCERAQVNLQLLNSDQVLSRDANADGTPEPLTAEQRASETDLANRQVSAFCGPTER